MDIFDYEHRKVVPQMINTEKYVNVITRSNFINSVSIY